MISDTIMVRVDTTSLRSRIALHPASQGRDIDLLLEKTLLALERQITQEIREFEKGQGQFESCLYEAL